MKDDTRSKIIEVANYIINNTATIKEAAEACGKSPSTIKKYINDDDKLKKISAILYEEVKKAQEEVYEKAVIKGGETGKREGAISHYEVEEFAYEIIENGWTLQEAASHFNVPKSTIYDNLSRITDPDLKEKLQEVFDYNKESAFKK